MSTTTTRTTFARYEGGWAVRVPLVDADRLAGTEVAVTKRSGEVSSVQCGEVIRRFPDAALLALGGEQRGVGACDDIYCAGHGVLHYATDQSGLSGYVCHDHAGSWDVCFG